MIAVIERWAALLALAAVTAVLAFIKGAQYDAAQRDLQAARTTAQQQTALATAYATQRQRDAKAATDMAALGHHFQESLTRAKTDRDRLVARLRAGDVRLQRPANNATASGLRLPGTTGTGSSGDGAEGAELPAATAADLATLAGEADDVTRQLGACQATVTLIRNACHAQAE